MRITVIIEIAYNREESGDLVAAGVVMPDDGLNELIAEYKARDEEFEGYPWMAQYRAGLGRWDIRFPSPSIDTPYNEHETGFVIDSIKRAFLEHINSFAYSDD